MSVTGTNTFDPQVWALIEEAYERCGIEARFGYQFTTAVRTLNFLLMEWANMGINLWTIEFGEIPLVQGQPDYQLPANTIDLVAHVIRQNQGNAYTQVDLVISRIPLPTYSVIPNKLSQGRPVQIYIDRLSPNPIAKVWPTPDNGSYILAYWMLRRMDDAGTGVNTLDIPFRFYEAMAAGLAYKLSMKQPANSIQLERVQLLKAAYDESLRLAQDEDRDRSPVRLIPGVGFTGSGGWGGRGY
jgi:hypothetical protein